MSVTNSKVHLAIIFANYGPYHMARIQAANRVFNKRKWIVTGIELARSQTEYQWQTSTSYLPFELITLFQDSAYENVLTVSLIQRLWKALFDTNPNVLALSGYSEPAMIAALAWAKLNRKMVILLSESKEDDAPRSAFKERFKKWLISHYDAALVGGKPQKHYLECLGLDSETIQLGYNVVENTTFDPRKTRCLDSPLKKPFFLSINRFVEKKNLPFLLNAYADYRRLTGNTAWDLVLCGDGELRQVIESEIARLSLAPYVHLPGFLQQNELLPYFAHANCFIHASLQEQWGLVVNEAMAAGIPPLVSTTCGCFQDLIIEGVTGFGFDPTKLDQLSGQMAKISQESYNLTQIGQAALARVNQYFSTDKFGLGLAHLIDYTYQLRHI